jgi:type IV secretory pathway VirB10-like protein
MDGNRHAPGFRENGALFKPKVSGNVRRTAAAMNITPALFAVLLTSTLVAQEPAKPQLRTTPPSPVAPPPAVPAEPLPLIPETLEQPAEKHPGSALIQPKRDKTSDAEDELASRIRLRELRNKVLKDPKVQAEWERAHTVKTDAEKRAALTSYYTLLYTKMAKLDGSLQKRITVLQTLSIRRLTPRNIDPSNLLETRDDDESDR